MEHTKPHDSEVSSQQTQYLTPTKPLPSEKLDDSRAEADSILEAIEVDSSHASLQGDADKDPEKAIAEGAETGYEPATKTVTAQDWTSLDDPENPHNWSMFKRIMHVWAVASLGMAVTIGSSIITPATPEIEKLFHASRTAAILSLSLFVLGLGIGPTIAAPISETFGRSVVYKGSAPIFMLFILGAGFSKTFGGLLVCRLLAGMAGGPVLAVGAGTVADTTPTHNRAIASAFFIMAPFLGPALGTCPPWTLSRSRSEC